MLYFFNDSHSYLFIYFNLLTWVLKGSDQETSSDLGLHERETSNIPRTIKFGPYQSHKLSKSVFETLDSGFAQIKLSVSWLLATHLGARQTRVGGDLRA